VKEYFLRVIPKKYSQLQTASCYKEIKCMSVDKTAKATFLFVISFAEMFTRVLALLQREEPLVHIMHSEISQLLLTIK